jgi:hypothetical protein
MNFVSSLRRCTPRAWVFVFNHTAESGADGRSLTLKGWSTMSFTSLILPTGAGIRISYQEGLSSPRANFIHA